MIKHFICIFCSVALCATSRAQEPGTDPDVQKGNTLYKQQQYKEAETAYTEALQKTSSNTTAKFNRTNAMYRQAKNADAIKELNDLAFKTNDNELKSKAYYNKGVILSGEKKLEESIEAYKDALRKNPNDQQARENLQKALLELKKKEPAPNKQNKQQQQQKQQQKQQPQPRMNQKEAQQRLKLLEQKEKSVQERLQKERSKTGGGQPQDW